jgi:DNA replication protein DnaC
LHRRQMLGELSVIDSDSALRRRPRHYTAPQLLVIDEVGYLSYSNRHADLLFEPVNRRYEQKSTMITTNRCFADWGECATIRSSKSPRISTTAYRAALGGVERLLKMTVS